MRAKIRIPEKEITDRYSDLEYLCYIIAFHGAPTIQRKKASSLITFKNSHRNLREIWLKYQKEWRQYFPLQCKCLCQREDSITVLFYHSDLLETCLNKEEVSEFLHAHGYQNSMNSEEKLEYLARRYEKSCPHEIGVFLDYPLHDVKAFQACRHEKCLMTGYWKVYAKEQEAMKKFKEYDYSRYSILEALIQGVSPKMLAYI